MIDDDDTVFGSSWFSLKAAFTFDGCGAYPSRTNYHLKQ
jgi:hypothetical protein